MLCFSLAYRSTRKEDEFVVSLLEAIFSLEPIKQSMRDTVASVMPARSCAFMYGGIPKATAMLFRMPHRCIYRAIWAFRYFLIQ